MSTGKNLTARCLGGCEVWLHPKAVPAHTDRCPRVPWTDRRLPVSEVLLAGDQARQALEICPDEVLALPTFSKDRGQRYVPGLYLREEVRLGIVVRSPLEGITGRRWWRAFRLAAQQGTPRDRAFDPAGFDALERSLGIAGTLVTCEICGDDLPPGRLGHHQRTNSVCRFLADTATVQRLWDTGYRDPYSLRHEGLPLTWYQLKSRVAWRDRLHIVPFRLWNAVLLAPEPSEASNNAESGT
jgi:hypothetical protein